VMRIHVTEEARHVKYAREDLARTLQRSTVVDREFARYVAAQAAMLLAKTFTRPSMYARAGLDPSAAAAAAAANPAHREMKRHGARKVVGFLTEQDMIGGPSKVLWQRSGLI
ncbi:MAG: diiron oxygenase, partial [Sciscionella sp.]